MSGLPIGLFLEAIVAILLGVTIVYCYIVNKKLTALRADQDKLKDVIGVLDRSTRKAEVTIIDLKKAVAETQEEFDERIDFGRSTIGRLDKLIEDAENIMAEKDKRTDRPVQQTASPASSSAPIMTVEPQTPTHQTPQAAPRAERQNVTPPPAKPAPLAAKNRKPVKTQMRLSNLMRAGGGESAPASQTSPQTTPKTQTSEQVG